MKRSIASFVLVCISFFAISQPQKQVVRSRAQILSPDPGPPTVVVVPGAIQLTVSYSPTVCNFANGSITASATGGTPPYRFADDGVTFQSNGNFTGLYNTYYTVAVEDALGQKNSTSVLIGYTGNSTSMFVPAYVNPTGCATSDGSITVQGYNQFGQGGPFLYSMDGVNFQANSTFSNLSAGNYTFFVQDPDGCIDTAYFPIDPNCAIQGVWDYSPSACQNEGYIHITNVTGGTAPYVYSLNNGAYQATASFAGLTAGLYQLRIKDATGQTMLYSFPIFQGCSISATATPTDASCNNTDGSISVTQTGGTAPYKYSIDGSNFQTSNVFSGLPPGEYTVTVDDASGLQGQSAASIHNNCTNRVTATTTNTTCGASNGQIQAVVVNGTPPFQYSIDGVNFQSSDLFTGVAKGTYTVTAIDVNNVKMTTIATVVENFEYIPNAFVLPTSCAYNDGIVIVSAQGPGPYEYGLTPFDFQTSNVFKNQYVSSDLTIYLKGPYGCITERCCFYIQPNCISVTAVTADAKCGLGNGSITATGTSGATPYSYSIDGVNFQQSNVFNNLPAGDYTVTIKGANGAMSSAAVTIKANCLLAGAVPVDAACGKSDGSITVTGSGGSIPYAYSLDGVNFTGNTFFSGLSAGAYTITLKDATGVTAQTSAVVGNIAGPQLTANPLAATCKNNDGAVTVVVSGGTAPLVYSVLQGGISTTGLTGLAAGPCTVMVTDANGCVGTATATVPLTNDLTVSVASVQPVCEGLTLPLSAVSAGSSFAWSPSAGLTDPNSRNPVLTASSTQTYTVTASLGPCQSQGQVLVTVLPAPVATVSSNVTVCYGKNVSLSGSGGETYLWTPATFLDNPGVADPTVEHPSYSVAYNLSVTGANGCTSIKPAQVVVTVSPPAQLFTGNDTTVAIGEPLQLQAIDVNHTGFSNYSWSPEDGLNNPTIANPIAVLDMDENYTVTAYSDAGCEASGTIRVKVYAGPDIYVPNAFTPNGDGHNDVLRAIPVGIRQFKYFMIYNRFGQLVFTTADPSKGWDGGISGQPQPAGTFVWEAEGVDYLGHVLRRKGTVVLVR